MFPLPTSEPTSPQPPVPTSAAKPPGRPRALDETKRREVCALVSQGCGLAGAARYVGCDASTIRREARRNPDFALQLRHAERECELAPLTAMHKAASRYWRAAAWLLERTQSQRFAKHDARAIMPEQLGEFFGALCEILFREVENDWIRTRVKYAFDQVRDYCDQEIAAQRNPFPIPRSVLRLDESPGSPYEKSLRARKEAREFSRQAEERMREYDAVLPSQRKR
jgi:hypothetical protein